MKMDFRRLQSALSSSAHGVESGRVRESVGGVFRATGPMVAVGELCMVSRGSHAALPAEVVGFSDRDIILSPLGDAGGVTPGSTVTATGRPLSIVVGPQMLGRVVDALGEPLDGRPLRGVRVPVEAGAPPALDRQRIRLPFTTGVRAIDGLIGLGIGQRVSIFAGSGVGKSTLMGMIAERTRADAVVFCFVGERGREVREFLDKSLGREARARSVVVVATSDQCAMLRARAAFTATTIAEHFRDQGQDVVLFVDSLTRFAMAMREVGLAAGEPPATRGYTPSVFAALPRLLERAGPAKRGSITGLYTVLVDGDDMNEPVTDSVRSILDGHIVLSRALASENHYPAIDVLESVSRLMTDVCDEAHREAAGKVRKLMATYREFRDLVNIGAYKPGANADLDAAIAARPAVLEFLRQRVDEQAQREQTVARLQALAGGAK